MLINAVALFVSSLLHYIHSDIWIFLTDLLDSGYVNNIWIIYSVLNQKAVPCRSVFRKYNWICAGTVSGWCKYFTINTGKTMKIQKKHGRGWQASTQPRWPEQAESGFYFQMGNTSINRLMLTNHCVLKQIQTVIDNLSNRAEVFRLWWEKKNLVILPWIQLLHIFYPLR